MQSDSPKRTFLAFLVKQVYELRKTNRFRTRDFLRNYLIDKLINTNVLVAARVQRRRSKYMVDQIVPAMWPSTGDRIDRPSNPACFEDLTIACALAVSRRINSLGI
jgi:hypothetical protein